MVDRIQPRPESRQDQDDVVSTQQLSRVHQLDSYSISLKANGKKMDRIPTTYLLGTEIQQNLNWSNDTNTN